jgi:hypothetical protein
MLDAVLGAILTTAPAIPATDVATRVVSLAAVVPQLSSLTVAERELMTEWLSKSIDLLQN